jgi:hypothetical protein
VSDLRKVLGIFFQRWSESLFVRATIRAAYRNVGVRAGLMLAAKY